MSSADSMIGLDVFPPHHIKLDSTRWDQLGHTNTTAHLSNVDLGRKFDVIVPPFSEKAIGNDLEQARPLSGFARRERRRLKIPSPNNVGADRLWLMQKWQGQVLKIEGDTFTAQLLDLSNPNIIEIAEFNIFQIAAEEFSLLRSGALFYWFIGYRDVAKTRIHVSQIWMRRGGRLSLEK